MKYEKIPLIYCLTNKVNGKRYVGQTMYPLAMRWAHHVSYAKNRKGSMAITRAITKYGPDSFLPEEVERLKYRDQLNVAETFYIIKLKSHISEHGYNLTYGGDQGLVYTKSLKPPPPISAETREKLSKINLGRKHSIESRKNMSAGQRKRIYSPEACEKLKARPRHPHSEETKLKISLGHRGKVVPDELRKKMALVLRGKIRRRRIPMPEVINFRTECSRGHTYNQENPPYITRAGNFNCRKCQRERLDRKKAKRDEI